MLCKDWQVRSFYSAFEVSPEETQGKLLYALGDGQWDIPKLRLLLEQIIPEHGVMEDYEVEHDDRFPDRIDNALRQSAGVCDIDELFSEVGFLHMSLRYGSTWNPVGWAI